MLCKLIRALLNFDAACTDSLLWLTVAAAPEASLSAPASFIKVPLSAIISPLSTDALYREAAQKFDGLYFRFRTWQKGKNRQPVQALADIRLYAAQSPMWFIGWFQHFMEILLAKDHFILLQPLTIQRKALCYVFFQDSRGPDT